MLELGHAKIQHLGPHPAGQVLVGHEEDVGGLQVPVDDVGLVGNDQGRADLLEQTRGEAGGLAPLTAQLLQQALTLEQLHHQVDPHLFHAAAVVDAYDAGVRDGIDRPGLIDEALDHGGVREEAGVQHLDGHAAADHRVFGQEHLPHAARAQGLEDAVAADGLADESGLLGQISFLKSNQERADSSTFYSTIGVL